MQLKTLKIEKPDDMNFVLGQTHFIKTVDDIHEALAEGFSAADRVQAVRPTPVMPGELRRRAALDRRRLAMFVVGLPVYFALCMFLPAGTWKWPQGWLFIGVFLTMTTAAAHYLWRVNPDVVVHAVAAFTCPKSTLPTR